jgi:DNA-binding response OmpR family regulator
MNDSRKRVLIIEDNAAFLNMIKIRLELNGFEAIPVEDGMEGLNIARKEMPDLIILDLALPAMGGSQESEINLVDRQLGHKICRMIKFDPRLKNIPILILTASDSVDDEEIARKVGADAFVVKTTTTEKLIDTVNTLLSRAG